MNHSNSCITFVAYLLSASLALSAIAADSSSSQAHSSILTITAPPTVTTAHEIDLKGKAAPKAQITVDGGAKTATTRTDSSGKFSVQVSLKRDQINALLIYATADNGVKGAPVAASIMQNDANPKITATLEPAPSSAGWNTGPVTVKFTCTDSSGSASCSPPVTVTKQGADQSVEGTAVDNAGNRSTVTVKVSIDSTPPVGVVAVSPRPNANGWNRADVTARFVCTDGGSGVAQCPAAVTITNEGVSEVSGTVIDKAGNRSSASGAVKIDRSAPAIFVDEPQEGALVHSTPVHLKGHVNEALSGLETVSCGNFAAVITGLNFTCDVPIDAGKNRIKLWASDRAGNVGVIHQHVALGPLLPGGDAHQARVNVDVDGDGIFDVAYTNFLTGEVSILAGNGDGSFRAERKVTVGTYPSSLTVVDLNGDGIPDLITTHYTTGEAKIHYGQRNGSYVDGPQINVGSFPSGVAVADVDGDGRLDVITTHMHNARAHIHRLQADGTYITQPIQVGDGPAAVAVRDVNGDGLADIVTANFVSGDVSILLGRPGRFQSEQRIALTAAAGADLGPDAIMIDDVNSDGILDIATANFNTNSVSLLLGTGQGKFQQTQTFAVGRQPITVSAADFTGDGRVDLVTVNLGSADKSVLPSQSSGTFGSALQVALYSAPVHVIGPGPTYEQSLHPGISSGITAAANMPDPFFAPIRAPAPGLPDPVDRMGITFGQDTSDYGQLLGENILSYPPLVTAGRAGLKWIRFDGDRTHFFGPGASMSYANHSLVVDRLLAAGFNVHIILSDFRWWPPGGNPFPADFPSAAFLEEYTQFAIDLARATYRPGGRVIFEVWNEPDLFGMFWAEGTIDKQAPSFVKMLVKVTEAIHIAVPGAIVVSGGLTSEGEAYGEKFLPLYMAALKGRPQGMVERFGFHPYLSYRDTLTRFRKQLDKNGFTDTPIDITEVGAWGVDRDWTAKANAQTILRALESDIPHVNFWSILSPNSALAYAGFMDPAPGDTYGCNNSTYGAIEGTRDFHCWPAMYAARTFDRVARGRTYQGAYFDARAGALPGSESADPSDELSGVRALKFESNDDVVVAAFTLDWARPIPGSGRTYSVAFPREPAFALSETGQEFVRPNADGRYDIVFDHGPVYFFFPKSGQPPVYNVAARAVCADGSPAHSGSMKIWYTMWPTPTPSAPLDWQSSEIGAAGTFRLVTTQLITYTANLYVAVEAGNGSGIYLPLVSSTHTGGVNVPTVTGATFFNPPTPMARISSTSTASTFLELNYQALPEWCTP